MRHIFSILFLFVLAGLGTGWSLAIHAPLALAPVALAPGALAAEDKRLLIFGDSLVAGYGLAPGQAFPDKVQEALDAQAAPVTVINGGVSGDTMAGGASRIGWSLADKPDAVVVVLGGNDALRGLPTQDMARHLDSILNAIAAEGIPVLLAGMHAPANMGTEYGTAFHQVFVQAFAARKTSAEILFYPFFLEGVALEPHLNQADGIHPNQDGVAQITRRIMPRIDALLERAETRESDG